LRTINRAKEIWAELDYAQRRLIELQTGIPVGARRDARKVSRSADELERLFAA
jgi:hypothetical protein